MKLGAPMASHGLRLEPMAGGHREALKAACAEDAEIWSIYSISYDPEHFDESFDALASRPDAQPFVLASDGKLLVGGVH